MNLVEEIAVSPPNASPVVETFSALDASSTGKAVLDRTLDTLVKASLIQKEERDAFERYLLDAKTAVGDILPVMAELREIEFQMRPEALEKWARAMAPILKRRTPLVPFGSKLLNTTAIYELFPEVFECARVCKCPIIFSEDSDVIGIGMVNPVAGMVMNDRTTALIREKTGASPFISSFLLDLNSWEKICERHFES